MKKSLKLVVHFVLLNVELFALLSGVMFAVLTQFKPIGIMTSAEGDVLRFCFAEGQDDLLSRCQSVQVAFVTKKVPKAFSDPNLVVREPIVLENRYAWHIIKAPIGTTAFRFDVQWKRNVQPSRTGPDLSEIWLGKKCIDWAEMKQSHEVHEALTIPCYWFRPKLFFNLNCLDFLKFILLYLVFTNGLLVFCWCKLAKKKKGR